MEEETGETDVERDEDIPKLSPQETTARFYFQLTFQLANDDITRMSDVENQNVYLCLSVASLLKDRAIKQNEELKKLKQNNNLT
mgnify:CR=1 FL=1